MKNAFGRLTLLCSTALVLTGCIGSNPATNDIQLTPESSPALTQGTPPMNDQPTTAPAAPAAPQATEATIVTSKGPITVKLYPESAPNTVKNFLSKAQSSYYKNMKFHRVEDWVIQGGDPLGTGTGGGDMPTELSQQPFVEGSLGVARGPNVQISNDSQFFICTTDCAWLTGQYTNFGQVTSGMDVAKKITVGDTISEITYK